MQKSRTHNKRSTTGPKDVTGYFFFLALSYLEQFRIACISASTFPLFLHLFLATLSRAARVRLHTNHTRLDCHGASWCSPIPHALNLVVTVCHVPSMSASKLIVHSLGNPAAVVLTRLSFPRSESSDAESSCGAYVGLIRGSNRVFLLVVSYRQRESRHNSKGRLLTSRDHGLSCSRAWVELQAVGTSQRTSSRSASGLPH